MNDFKFVSEEYSKNNTHKYRLSIQINPDGFSVLMIGEENTILQIIHTQTNAIENTRKLFRSEENLINLRELTFKSFDLFIFPTFFRYSSLLKKQFYRLCKHTQTSNYSYTMLATVRNCKTRLIVEENKLPT